MAKFKFTCMYPQMRFHYPVNGRVHYGFFRGKFETDDERVAEHLRTKIPDAIEVETFESADAAPAKPVSPIEDIGAIILTGIQLGVIEKKGGGWLRFGEEKLGNNPDAVAATFDAKPELLLSIREAIAEAQAKDDAGGDE